MNISDKHILVTGGSKGVGAALVTALLSRSARVTIAARPSTDLDLLAMQSGVTAMPVDLADFDALDGYIARAERANGPVDVLVNNTALMHSGTIAKLSRAQLQDQINTNLFAPMELCRQALPGMLTRNHGVILNLSSLSAEIGIPNLPAYVATKAGLTNFTVDLQGDLQAQGSAVRAAVLVPGEIPDTQINAGFRADSAVAKLANRFARLPVLTPGQVARNIIELLADPKQTLLILPRYTAPLVQWRQLPIRLTRRLIR